MLGRSRLFGLVLAAACLSGAPAAAQVESDWRSAIDFQFRDRLQARLNNLDRQLMERRRLEDRAETARRMALAGASPTDMPRKEQRKAQRRVKDPAVPGTAPAEQPGETAR